MSDFMIVFWMGGCGVAYRENRNRGYGRFKSAFEGVVWIYGLGRGIARAFYENEDWEDA